MLYRYVKYGDSRVGTFSHDSDYSFFKIQTNPAADNDGIELAKYCSYKIMRDSANEAYANYVREHQGEVSGISYKRIRLSAIVALSPLQKRAASRNWLTDYHSLGDMDLLIENGRYYF